MKIENYEVKVSSFLSGRGFSFFFFFFFFLGEVFLQLGVEVNELEKRGERKERYKKGGEGAESRCW